MMSCDVCGEKDRVMRDRGFKLCWSCRRIPGLNDIPESKTSTRLGQKQITKPTALMIMKEVREKWLLQNTKK